MRAVIFGFSTFIAIILDELWPCIYVCIFFLFWSLDHQSLLARDQPTGIYIYIITDIEYVLCTINSSIFKYLYIYVFANINYYYY